MNIITIKGKSYKLCEGKRGGKYIMKGGKKIYQTNLEKEQTGAGFFGKSKIYNVSNRFDFMDRIGLEVKQKLPLLAAVAEKMNL